MAGISKSKVGALARGDRRAVRTILERPIEGDWPYLWNDATDRAEAGQGLCQGRVEPADRAVEVEG